MRLPRQQTIQTMSNRERALFSPAQMKNKLNLYLGLKAMLLALGLFYGSTTVQAGWSEAIAAYKRGDYVTAQKHWLGLAMRGDSRAQFNIGLMYRGGIGVSKDFEKALAWFNKAAADGELGALANIGDMYANGEGVPRNYRKAADNYRLASEKGHPAAQYRLGRLYVDGKGVPRNYARAVELFEIAAEKNYPYAQHQLAVMNEKSLGVPRNIISAYRWYSAAASGLEGEARARVQDALESLLKRMTPAQIAQAAVRTAQILQSTEKPQPSNR